MKKLLGIFIAVVILTILSHIEAGGTFDSPISPPLPTPTFTLTPSPEPTYPMGIPEPATVIPYPTLTPAPIFKRPFHRPILPDQL